MLGSAVRMLREQERLSQTELAAQAGLAVTLIAQIEGGEVDPTWGDMRRIAAALDTTVDRLAALVEEIEKDS
ncbi:MAG: helix-turn-helix domain-containing protein [Solirubrobacterales bacterium]